MILAIVNIDGDDKMKVYYSYEQLHKDLSCPDDFLVWGTDFKIKGKTYKERKEFARDIGITISNNREIEDLIYKEAILIGIKLYKIAKRYGLIEEFREIRLVSFKRR